MDAHCEAISIDDAIKGAAALAAKRINIVLDFSAIDRRNLVVIIPLCANGLSPGYPETLPSEATMSASE
jgi:hypothetical protein